MQPNSALLVITLFLAAAGLVYVIIRQHNLYLRIGSGVLTIVLAAVGGMAVVNDYYGYYTTWSQLSADLSGSYAQFTTTAIGSRTTPALAGRVETVQLPGRHSAINRLGYVYLPPQYFQPAFAHVRFPVIELLHGTPSYAASWLVHMHVNQVADQLISNHVMGPSILVMPQTYSGHTYQECLNSTNGQDATYLVSDIRHDIVTRFRAAHDPAQWAAVGISSGGYCAANLAMRYPSWFGAAGIVSGYFRPQDGPAAAVLRYNVTAENANDPILLARRLTSGAAPLPSFWVSAGTGDRADLAGAQAFVAALHGVEAVTLDEEPGGGHNFYAFRPALNRVLPWAWTQIAPPSLRVRFPIAGGVTRHTVAVQPHRGLPKSFTLRADRPPVWGAAGLPPHRRVKGH